MGALDDASAYGIDDYDTPEATLVDEYGEPVGALDQANLAGGAPNPGALSEAQKVLEESQGLRKGYIDEYKSIQQQQQERADAARNVLRQARERVAHEQYDPAAKWFGLAAALGSPTRTGTFGETVGNAGAALQQDALRREGWRKQHEDEQAKYEMELANYGNGEHAIDPEMMRGRLGLLQLQMKLQSDRERAALAAMARAGGSGGAQPEIVRLQTALAGMDPSDPRYAQLQDRIKKLNQLTRDPNAPVALTDADKATMQKVHNYELDLNSALSRASGEKRSAMLAYLNDIGGYDQTLMKPFQQALLQYGSNKNTDPGGQVRAFGTTIEHLHLVKELARLTNAHGDPAAIAEIKNKLSRQFGGAAITDLKSAMVLLAPELQSAVTAGPGGEAERLQIQALIDGSSKPSVVESQIGHTMIPMMVSKLRNHMSGFYSNVPEAARERYRGFIEKKIPKATRKLVQKYGLEGDWDLAEDTVPSGPGTAPAAPHPSGLTPAQRAERYRQQAAAGGG